MKSGLNSETIPPTHVFVLTSEAQHSSIHYVISDLLSIRLYKRVSKLGNTLYIRDGFRVIIIFISNVMIEFIIALFSVALTVQKLYFLK